MNRKSVLLWAILWAVASFSLSLTSFESSSNDSKFYSRLIGQLNSSPVSNWIAPKWGENYWGHAPENYIHDHFVGNLIPGVIFARLGVPEKHALNIVQMLISILSLFLLVKISSLFVSEEKSIHLLWMLQLMPIAFTYGIRANHEQGMMFWMLMSIYGGLLYKKQKKNWLLPLVLGSAGILLVKGAPAVFVPLFMVFISYLANEKDTKWFRDAVVLFGLSAIAIVGTAVLYDFVYERVTGFHFLEKYWVVQIKERSLEAAGSKPFALQKLSNFWYYFNRSIFYTAPFSLISIFIFFRRNEIVKIFNQKFGRKISEKRRFFLLLFFVGMLQILAFSVSNRRGSRYIFPVFYLFATGFNIYLLYGVSWMKKLTKKLTKVLGLSTLQLGCGLPRLGST